MDCILCEVVLYYNNRTNKLHFSSKLTKKSNLQTEVIFFWIFWRKKFCVLACFSESQKWNILFAHSCFDLRSSRVQYQIWNTAWWLLLFADLVFTNLTIRGPRKYSASKLWFMYSRIVTSQERSLLACTKLIFNTLNTGGPHFPLYMRTFIAPQITRKNCLAKKWYI